MIKTTWEPTKTLTKCPLFLKYWIIGQINSGKPHILPKSLCLQQNLHNNKSHQHNAYEPNFLIQLSMYLPLHHKLLNGPKI